MAMNKISVTSLAMLILASGCVTTPDIGWRGRRVVFLGDSITDPHQPHAIYWQYLGKWLDWDVTSYGVGGAKWSDIGVQIDQLEREKGDAVDAIFILMGTNDYQRDRPLGVWYDLTRGTVEWRRKPVALNRRDFSRDNGTVRGSINLAMERLKRRWPRAQILVMTPIHRAVFGEHADQPSECWPNESGVYLDKYVDCIRETGDVWSVPVIDLYREAGLMPFLDEHAHCFRSAEKDRLHPNAVGHERLAKVIMGRINSLPGAF